MILLLRFIMFCLAVFIADDSLCKSSEPLEDMQDSVKCVDMLSRLCAADKKLVFIINVFFGVTKTLQMYDNYFNTKQIYNKNSYY